MTTLVSTTPQTHDNGVATDTLLTMVFSETIVPTSGTYINICAGGTIRESIEATAVNIVIADTMVIIEPTKPLCGLIDYFVLVESGAFNDFIGISSSGAWTFQTGDEASPKEWTFLGNDSVDGRIEWIKKIEDQERI